MERIIHHLEQLIILHDYVILPEFGGFIVNSVSARIDMRNNAILAPHKEIYFNPALSHNDGLLTSAIQQEENIPFRKAQAIVNESIDELQKRIKTGETIQLGKIGAVHKNTLGQTEFLPRPNYDFLPDNIGAVSTRLSVPRNEEDSRIILQIPGNRKRFYKIAAAISVIVAIAALAPVLHMQFSPYLAKINPLSFLEADTLPLFNSLPKHYTQGETKTGAAIVSDSIPGEYNDQIQYKCAAPWHVITGSFPTKNEAIGNAQQLQKQTTLRDVAVAYSNNLKKQEVKPASPEPVEVRTQAIATPNTNLPWHVVVANFETPKKAKRFLEIMAHTNKTPLAAYGGNNVYRIITGSFATQKEANAHIANIRKQPDFATAWILHNPTLLKQPVASTQAPITTTPAATQKAVSASQNSMAAIPNPAINNQWHVIVSNFTSAAQAQQFVAQIQRTRKFALYIYGAGSSYKVIAGSFASEKNAVNKLVEIKRVPEFRNAWILENPSLYKSQVRPTANASISQTSYKATTTDQATRVAPTTTVPTLQPGTWYAIVANFTTLVQAQKYAGETSRRTKINLSVIKDNRLYRVIGGSFNTRGAVAAKIQELHQYSDFAEAWPLCKP